MQGYIKRPDGTGLYYVKDQAAAPRAAVLIIHGYAEHSGQYAYAARELSAAGYTVYRADSRGHGRSAADLSLIDGHSLEDYMGDAAAVVEHISAETGLPVFMLGHSMGALIACAYGVTHKGKLAGQITVGAPYEHPEIYDTMPVLREAPGDTVIRSEDIRGLVRAEDAGDPLVLRAAALGFCRSIFLGGPDYVESRIASHSYPLLMFHGQQDKMISPEASVRFLKESASEDKTLVLRPRAGHSLLREPGEQEYVVGYIAAWMGERCYTGGN